MPTSAMMEEIQLNNRWLWVKEGDNGFTVKAMKKLIQDQHQGEENIKWNPWIPSRSTFFVGEPRERLLTRKALCTGGLQLDSHLCPICNSYVQDMEHLITACEPTNRIRHLIASWCKIPSIYVFNVSDLWGIYIANQVSARLKKSFYAIIFTAS